jgi:hypothetical protein
MRWSRQGAERMMTIRFPILILANDLLHLWQQVA